MFDFYLLFVHIFTYILIFLKMLYTWILILDPKKMGNLFSKRHSLPEIIFTLEERINKLNVYLEKTTNTRSYIVNRLYLFSMILVPFIYSYTYFEEKDLLTYFIFYLSIIFIIRFFILQFFKLKINRTQKTLKLLKETQNKNIEELKKERLFVETQEIIHKYESKPIDVIKVKKENKLIDNLANIILGDDVENMYALICEKCHSHNGLKHPNEKELMKFYCYNCKHFNDKSVIKKNI